MLRTGRDGLGELVSYESGVDCGDQLITQQQFGSEVDVNSIVRRFGVTGQLPVVARDVASYGDFSEVYDFHGAMNAVVAGQAAFKRLPASVRERFGNSAGALWEWLQDDSNEEEAVRLGLFKAVEAVTPPVPPVAAVPAPAPAIGG